MTAPKLIEPVPPVPTAIPFWYIVPPTCKSPPIPAPPATTNEPVRVDVDEILPLTNNCVSTVPVPYIRVLDARSAIV